MSCLRMMVIALVIVNGAIVALLGLLTPWSESLLDDRRSPLIYATNDRITASDVCVGVVRVRRLGFVVITSIPRQTCPCPCPTGFTEPPPRQQHRSMTDVCVTDRSAWHDTAVRLHHCASVCAVDQSHSRRGNRI